MIPRYLLVLPQSGMPLPDWVRAMAERQRATMIEDGWGAALALGSGRMLTLGDAGVICGTLFPRHGPPRALDDLAPDEAASIAASGGDRLLKRYWGGYIAVAASGGPSTLLRDPSGALPCYLANRDGCTLAASDLTLLAEASGKAALVDWPAVGRFLYLSDLPAPETCIAGVEELLPGFRIQVSTVSPGQRPAWRPQDHWAPADEDASELSERLGRVVTSCVQAWASEFRYILLSVSGGLDSSIVGAALSGARADAACITLYGDDPASDERHLARLLCRHLGLPMAERRLEFADVDLATAVAPHLPRPVARIQSRAFEAAHLAVAAEREVDAFFSGNGGDNVFAYSQSAAALADRFLVQGLSGGTFTTLLDVCRQTGCGPAEAVRAAFRTLRRGPGYTWRPNTIFIEALWAAEMGSAAFRHPWLETTPDALPGKSAHVAMLLGVQRHLEHGRSRRAPVVNPLLSQPVVELCLSIPTWKWRSGGRDRAVARDAFAGRLPEAIVQRRSKGTPDAFSAAVLAQHWAWARERLLDGRVAGQPWLDRRWLEAVLSRAEPPPVAERLRILDLLGAEAWAECWTEGGPDASGGTASV